MFTKASLTILGIFGFITVAFSVSYLKKETFPLTTVKVTLSKGSRHVKIV